MIPDLAEVARWRQAIGAGAWTWARATLEVGDSGWTAFSGAPRADYNVAAVYGGDARQEVEGAIERVAAAGVPALLMLAGPGLAGAAELADRGWVCVTATPIVARRAHGDGGGAAADQGRPVEPGQRVGRLEAGDWDEAQVVLAAAFGIEVDLAAWALPAPDSQPERRTYGLWDDGRLVSIVGTALTSGIGTAWSLSTPPALQRRGYATTLFGSVMDDLWGAGAESMTFLASPPGMPLYLALGFRVVEHWQVWSRPRWVMGG